MSKHSVSTAPTNAPSMAEQMFSAIVAALSSDATITVGKMFGAPGLKIDGKVFAMLVKGQLVVKLPQARVAALTAAGSGASFDPGHGRRMREWVAIPPDAQEQWVSLVEEAKAFVAAGH